MGARWRKHCVLVAQPTGRSSWPASLFDTSIWVKCWTLWREIGQNLISVVPSGTWYTQINNRRRLSRCPIEGGSVHSVDYGTFAAGTIIASIAAGLQPQRVPISELHTIDWERTPWDARESTKSRTTAKGVRKLLRSLDVIDNGYAASLAGDLAEVCVYQGPHLNSSIKVGVGGHWNSTYLPRIR